VKRTLGLAPEEPSWEELKEWSRYVYDACTLCGRCTLVCPMGIDIAGAVRQMREGFVAADLAPSGLKQLIDRALATNSPMGITEKALRARVREAEEATGIPIHLDKQGADYMALFSSLQMMAYPEVLEAYARIFRQAGISWTISTKYFEGTNLGVQLGSSEIAGELVRRMTEAAEELGVKYVITPECGHVYAAIRYAGPNLIGRPYKFEVIHIIALLDRLLREGKLRLKGHDERVVTFHDPCQIVRRGGLVKEPRELIDAVAPNFREMPNAGVVNFCCGGGGGVSANPRAADLMDAAFNCKQAQFEAVPEVEEIISPCANCRSVLEQGLEKRGLDEDYPLTGLSEYLARFLDDMEEAPEKGAA
jgi:Fe-S oxidoreductase